jgi:hypothetical protein
LVGKYINKALSSGNVDSSLVWILILAAEILILHPGCSGVISTYVYLVRKTDSMYDKQVKEYVYIITNQVEISLIEYKLNTN